MSDRVETYDVSKPPRIDISSVSGDVVVKSGDANRVTVELSGDHDTVENTVIDATHDSVTVRPLAEKQTRRFFRKAVDIVVTAPDGGSVRIGSGSGDVLVRLLAEEVEVNSGSGDVRVDEDAGEVRIKVASGEVVVRHAVRDVEVASASGDIRVGQSTDARINTASGSVVLGTINGSARVKTASGDVRLKSFLGSDVDVATMSGDVILGLAPGRTVSARIKTVSGDFRNKISASDGEKTGRMTLSVKSFSGDVTLRTAK